MADESQQETAFPSAKHRITGREAVRNAVINTVRAATHRIYVCAPSLDPYLFSNEEITSLLASFAASHPRNIVRFLVEDGDATVRHNGRLVTVARKLGDFVQIRRFSEIHSHGNDMWMSVDTQGYLIQPDWEKPECIVDFEDRNTPAKYGRSFDEMWQTARIIPSINVVGL